VLSRLLYSLTLNKPAEYWYRRSKVPKLRRMSDAYERLAAGKLKKRSRPRPGSPSRSLRQVVHSKRVTFLRSRLS
jgi:hypothetical protein